MNFYLAEFYSTITSFPGNLTYHLIVSFSIAGALYLAYQNWRASGFPQGRRMVVGLSILLLLRLAFFFTSIFLLVFDPDSDLYLPPLDRTINTLSLLVLVWLWAFPEPSRTADTIIGISGCFILVLSGITLVNWSETIAAAPSPQGGVFFNEHIQLNSIWEGVSLGICLIGLVLLVVRRPNSWGLGMMMFLIMGFGHLAHLLFPLRGVHFAGSVRLAQLAAYPILLALPGRFIHAAKSASQAETPPLTVERRSYGTEAETFRAFTALVTETNPENLCTAYSRTISNIMLADICLLLVLRDKELTFECGYDLIREQGFPGATFGEQDLPLIASALERNKPLRLPASSTSPDLKSLSRSLETNRVGHLLAAPIPYDDDRPITGIVLLSPYSYRAWNSLDEEYLVEVARSLAKIASHNQLLGERERALEELENQLGARPSEPDEPRPGFATMHEWEWEAGDSVGFSASAITAATLAELITAHEDAQETNRTLQAEIDRLSQELQVSTPSPTLSGISEEVRQPLQSIREYSELLLSGSAGELTEEERKYVLRIRASGERIEASFNDILAYSPPGQSALSTNEPVSLYELIDEAIDFTRPQLREKNIAIRVDLPDQLPDLGVDREALQQILIFLLQNAGDATPLNGEIALHARPDGLNRTPGDILVQITDAGGGISEDDLPRVFSRLAYLEGDGITGVGDKGVGLALTKNLVEAQQGKIWVDSHPGDGATYNVLLPSYRTSSNGGPAHGSAG
ncbi:MAG TPA: GAF domain-containing sensor histidine kinase [Anaerolineales bacterium]|nr:GAF domain-containing sensor histidine kinase [Anaerolineales bacterium]